MKKFFELSIASRKQVKGTNFLTAEALSSEGEKVGDLVVNKVSGESAWGIFLRYTPTNCEEPITKIKLITEDQSQLQEKMEEVKNAVRKAILESGEGNLVGMMEKIMKAAMICSCIQPETGEILVPTPFLKTQITNELICKYLNDEWVGLEIKILPEIQQKVKELAEEKRKGFCDEQDEDTDGEEDDDSNICSSMLKSLYEEDEDEGEDNEDDSDIFSMLRSLYGDDDDDGE